MNQYNGPIFKRNTSYARPFISQSGKSSIPTVTIRAKKPIIKTKKIQIDTNTKDSGIEQIHQTMPNIQNFPEKIQNIQNYPENNDNKKSKNLKENKYQFVNEYLNLIRCTYPYCNCGNCIMKKNRDYSTGPNYNYQKSIKSNYRKEFDWKETEKQQTFKNAKMSHLDRGFREHIKPSMESVMHKDYKKLNNYNFYNSNRNNINNMNSTSNNFKNINNRNNNNNTNNSNNNFKGNNINNLNDEDQNNNNQNQENLGLRYLKNKDNNVQMNIPFLGRSSYDSQFPHWNTFIDKKTKEKKRYKQNEVPFSGKSSYMETYGNFEDKYYKEKTNPILKKDNLEIGSGNLICFTSTGNTYKPLDYKMAKDLNSVMKNSNNLPSMKTAPFSKDSFLSTYEKAFMDNDLLRRSTEINED